MELLIIFTVHIVLKNVHRKYNRKFLYNMILPSVGNTNNIYWRFLTIHSKISLCATNKQQSQCYYQGTVRA